MNYQQDFSKHSKKRIKIRRLIQFGFFALITLIVINHKLSEIGASLPFISNASLHALCPFGGIATLYELVTTGTILRQIQLSSIVLMVIIFVLALLLGPVFCGWICPLGTFQEWLSSLGKRIFGKKYNHFVPRKLDQVLRYLRYAVFIWVLYVIAETAEITMFKDIDPYYTLFNFWTGEVALGGIIVLLLTITFSLLVERPWCKYLCPYGALLGLTNLFRIFPVKIDRNRCISCKICERTCPMNITLTANTNVRNHQCISCYQCTSEEICPVEKTCHIGLGPANSPRYSLSSRVIGAILIVLLAGGIIAADSINLWQTAKSRSFLKDNNPDLLEKSGSNGSVDSNNSGEDEGSEGITGHTTFGELLTLGLTVEQIEAIIGNAIPSEGTTVKDYLAAQGISFGPIKQKLNAALSDTSQE